MFASDAPNPAPGAFEACHVWSDDLPEIESQEFQNGKSEALDKLMRFTHLDAEEAGAVVLKNGEEYDFQIGSHDEVVTRIPDDEPVAVLHSHPDGFPHSVRDWFNLLNYSSIEQSHVVTARKTYSMHKPLGWKLQRTAIESDVLFILNGALKSVAVETLKSSGRLSDEEFFEQASYAMARHYNVIYRIGWRKI